MTSTRILQLAIAVFLSLVVYVEGDLHCDPGWTLYYKGETCARHFRSPTKTWSDARKYCNMYGGDLIRIDDASKQTFFNNFHKGKYYTVWIGLKRTKMYSQTFNWLDDKKTIKYKYFSYGEPNNSGSHEDCISTWNSGSKWNDISCTRKFSFVCEKPAVHKAPVTCDEGWKKYGTNCFRMYKQGKSWHDAKSLCQSYQADLATIPNAGTTAFVNKNFAAHTDLWIGLNDMKTTNRYMWSNGYTQLGNYKNWSPGQPDNSGTHCVHLWSQAGHKWDDAPCTYKYGALCEKKANAADILCPYGWDLYMKTKVCLKTFTYSVNYNSARTTCQAYQADLVKITDTQMNNYLQKQLGSLPYTYWIGLHKNANSDKLSWLNEVTKITFNKASQNSWSFNKEVCGTVKGNNKHWGKDTCTQRHRILCERKAYAAVECLAGYTVHKKSMTCFKVSTDPLPWETARGICQKDGGDLVKANNYFINNEVSALAKKLKKPLWIGMHDRLKDNKFQWLDVGTTSSFTSWAKGQPNDTTGSLNCVQISSVDGRWYDDSCAKSKNYICQHKATISGYKPKVKQTKLTCPEGWSMTGKTCVKYYTDLQTWDGARKVCKKQGGDLIKMDNNDLTGYVNALLQSKKASVEPYIGLNDRTSAGKFTWLDETNKATFTNWHTGEPSHGSEHCAVVIVALNYNWEWNDVSCNSKKGYICQQKALLPGSMNCGEGWEDSPDTDYCYRFNKDTLNWREARTSCKTNGGDLVSVENSEEELYLTGRLQSATGNTFWTGGNDLTAFSGWQWTDGKPFAFFNWDFSQPNVSESDNCISVDKTTGRWTSLSCMTHKPSICKKMGHVINHPTPAPTQPPTNLPKGTVWNCPPKWYSFRGSCYLGYKVSSVGYSWKQANEFCHTLSANLVAITDNKENDFVFSLVPRGFGYAWIGLNDFKRRFSFSWSDGVTPVTFTNWMNNQPNVGGKSKSCVGMLDMTGKWQDDDCDHQRHYFTCKMNKKIISSSQYDQYKGCTKGGKGYYNRCFRLYPSPLKYDAAQKVCKTLGGNLATLSDRYAQAFVASEMTRANYWIGLSNTKATTVNGKTAYLYTWQSGDSFDFANWDRTHTGAETSTCVAVKYGKPAGLWHNFACSLAAPYMCEYPRPGYTTPVPFTTTTSLLPCPTGWFAIGHMCYQSFNDKRSWMDAKTFCESAVTTGGTLASVTSDDMSAKIASHLDTYNGPFWIGLSDRDQEGGYKWAGGESFNYQDWASGEPNNHMNQEDCVQWKFSGSSYNTWNDYNCYGACTFICQAPRGSNLMTTLVPATIGSTATQCGTDSSWTMYNGYCYLVKGGYYDSMDWFDARTMCHKHGAELASITDAKENGYLTTLVGKRSMTEAWIGLSDFDENVYKWVDGTPYTFLAWEKNEPNNYGNGERCGTIHSSGSWNDLTCNKNAGYICKKRPGSFSPISVKATVPTGGCPANYFGMEGTSRCFRVVGAKKADRKSFLSANTACGTLKHSRLASVHSATDQEFLTTLISKLDTPAWIGFSGESYSYSDTYTWVDNTKSDYVHWAPQQPEDDDSYYYSKKCTEMTIKPKIAGEWKAVSCYDYLPYICEYSKSSLFATNAPNTKDCPKGYVHFRDACYKYVSTLQNWTASETFCKNDYSNGHLATELGGFEKAFVDLALIKNKDDQIWIGLADNSGKNAFTWSSGWPVLYTSWGRGQPDLSKQCVTQRQNAQWSTADCSLQLPSVCKVDLVESSFVTPKIPGRCPSNVWTQYGEDCYYLEVEQKKTWPEASYSCVDLGGQLASAHNANDAKTIAMFLQTEQVDAWIGLHRFSQESSFTWVDRTEVEYFNWAAGSPWSTAANSSDATNCVIAQGNDGKWTDVKCMGGYHSYSYLCKVKQIPMVPSTTPTTTLPTTTITPTTRGATTKKPVRHTTRGHVTVPNPCTPNPCQHGLCTMLSSSSYYCRCNHGWSGTNCDQVKQTGTNTNPATNPTKATSKSSHVTHFAHNAKHAGQTSDNSHSSSGLSKGSIAGIVVGVMCLVAIIAIGAFLFRRHRMMNPTSSSVGAGFENAAYDSSKGGVHLQPSSSSFT